MSNCQCVTFKSATTITVTNFNYQCKSTIGKAPCKQLSTLSAKLSALLYSPLYLYCIRTYILFIVSIIFTLSQFCTCKMVLPVVTTATSFLPVNNPELLPIRPFMHKVLKHLCTSGIVLQSALCYLEAVHPEVPNLLHEERMGIRPYYKPGSRIFPITEAKIAQESEGNNRNNLSLLQVNKTGFKMRCASSPR